MNKALGLVLIGLLGLSSFLVFAEEALVPSNATNFTTTAMPAKPISTLDKLNGDTARIMREAFQNKKAQPVNLLVRVVQNPYAVPASTPKNGNSTNDDSTDTGLSGILSNPGEAINNLLSPTGAIGQVGVGLTIHF